MEGYLSLEALKKHLNIEEGYNDDDTYLESIIAVVEEAVTKHCDGGLDDLEAAPVAVVHASMLMAAHLYVNRTMVSFAQGYEIPYSFKFLLNPYRAY